MDTTFSYEAEASDLMAGYSLFTRVCKSSLRPISRLRLLGFVMLIGMLCAIATSRTFHPAMIAVLAFAAYLAFGLRWTTRRQLRKFFLNTAGPDKKLPIEVSFNEEGISFKLKGKSEAKFFWSGLIGSAEDERVFIIIPTKSTFYNIPKRALTNEALSLLRSLAPKETSQC